MANTENFDFGDPIHNLATLLFAQRLRGIGPLAAAGLPHARPPQPAFAGAHAHINDVRLPKPTEHGLLTRIGQAHEDITIADLRNDDSPETLYPHAGVPRPNHTVAAGDGNIDGGGFFRHPQPGSPNTDLGGEFTPHKDGTGKGGGNTATKAMI